MPVRSHIRRSRDLQWAGDPQRHSESESLLKRAGGTKRQINILIISAQQQAVAGEIAAKGERGLSASAGNQLQQAKARRKILPHGSGENRCSLAGARFGALRFALEPIGIYFKALADSTSDVQIRSLRAAARRIRSEQDGAKIKPL